MQKDNEEKSTSIKVYVRVRPLVGSQQSSNEIVTVEADCKTVNIETDAISNIQTKFDQAIPKDASQKEVFALFKDYMPKIPEGYNMTVFAYGQTGSGKTYTMFGSDWENKLSTNVKEKHQNTFFQDLESDENFAGLIPRAIYTLFEEVKAYTSKSAESFNIYCSFLQIYNEKIYDLLQDFPKPKALNLHESKLDGIFVEGLSEFAVTHYLDCLELMKRGQKNRFIRQTSMNTKSSRSHTIFQILLQSSKANGKGMFKKVRLNLCDLAGSEKVNKTEEMNEAHFKELKNINQSLTTLGKVIASLSSVKKSVAAFRQSKLTRLLQDSLTANTYTFIVGNISPSANNTEETLNTLKFVERARHIVMKVKPMQFNGQNMEVVIKLQKEIQYLKQLLNLKRKGMNPDDIHNRLVSLQEENEKLKKNVVSIQDVEKLIEENRKMKMEIHKLQMTQYAMSDTDGIQSRSEYSLNNYQKSNQFSNVEEITPKVKQGSSGSGFELPYKQKRMSSPRSNQNYSPRETKKSLVSAGRTLVESQNSSLGLSPGNQRKKEKQKILIKLEELERIQKFNEEKLMKDLEELEKKNQQQLKKVTSTPIKRKSTSTGSTEKKSPLNYEDKIKELEAKLFGK